MTEKPPWLKPHTIVVHLPSGLLFVVLRVQRDRKTQALWVSDGVPDDGDKELTGHCYPIEECDRGSVEHFQIPKTVWKQGVAIAIPRVDTYLVIEEGQLMIDPVYSAAIELAKEFDGVVVDITSGTEFGAVPEAAETEWLPLEEFDEEKPSHQMSILDRSVNN